MALVDSYIRRFLGTDDVLSEGAARDLLSFVGVLGLRPIDDMTVPRRTLPAVLVALSVLLATYDSMRGSRRSVCTSKNDRLLAERLSVCSPLSTSRPSMLPSSLL